MPIPFPTLSLFVPPEVSGNQGAPHFQNLGSIKGTSIIFFYIGIRSVIYSQWLPKVLFWAIDHWRRPQATIWLLLTKFDIYQSPSNRPHLHITYASLKMAQYCTGCQKTPPEVTLKHCAKCSVTLYCSRDCQKADWKAHNKVCDRDGSTAPGSPSGPDVPIANTILSPSKGLDQPITSHLPASTTAPGCTTALRRTYTASSSIPTACVSKITTTWKVRLMPTASIEGRPTG